MSIDLENVADEEALLDLLETTEDPYDRYAIRLEARIRRLEARTGVRKLPFREFAG